MKIAYWSYLKEYGNDRKLMHAALERVLSSGVLILGNEVASFEREFSRFCGAAHGVGVNSGTDALVLALKALGIRSGDEVITVANTAVPTVSAIQAVGATPVFVDVEDDTFLMDPGNIEPALSARTRCLLPVHLFGQTADMRAIMTIARQRGLHVVEDCAQATGALYESGAAGSHGDIGAFSFYPTKVLGAYGDGGMLVTDCGDLALKIRRLRFYGIERDYHSEEDGINSRLDEVHAAVLREKLHSLHRAVGRRQSIAERYRTGLQDVGDLRLPVVRPRRTHQYYTFTVRTDRRDRLAAFLGERGIETKINYPVPIHLMRGFSSRGYRPGDLPVTERLSGEILSLPLYPGLTNDEVDRVIEMIRSFYRQ